MLSRRLQLSDSCRQHATDSMGHSLLFCRGPEAQWNLTRWFQLGKVVGICRLTRSVCVNWLRCGFEIARLIGIRPCPGIFRASAVFVSVFLMYRWDNQAGFCSLIRVAAIFRFLLFFKGFHSWTQPLPHDGRCRCTGWSVVV